MSARTEPLEYEEYLLLIEQGIKGTIKIDTSLGVSSKMLGCKKHCKDCLLGRHWLESLTPCADIINQAIDNHKARAIQEHPEVFV